MSSGIENQLTGYHNRRSVRLPEHDYSRSGSYFITICIHDRTQHLFGEIVGTHGCASSCSESQMPKIVLNEFGRIALDEWERSFKIRSELFMDEYVIMPNHIHGIVVIRDDCMAKDARPCVPTKTRAIQNGMIPNRRPKSISSFVAGFKSATTKRINELRGTPGSAVWQSRFHDHVIRDEKSLFPIRTYIINNPLQWHLDVENPERILTGCKEDSEEDARPCVLT